MSLINIGYVRHDLQSLHYWCEHQSGMKSMSSSQVAFGRTHKWFEYEVILKPNPKIFQGYRDERLHRLGNRIFPGYNCALLCHYYPGGYMTRHCDHSVFEPLVVSVNIGRATLCIGNQEHQLEDGQVVSFNSQIPHALYPVVSDRWSLMFRRIKLKYLPF